MRLLIVVINKANKTVVNSFKNNKSRNLMHISNIGAMEKSIFLTLKVKKIFKYLKQVFIKAPIFQHFDLKSHI